MIIDFLNIVSGVPAIIFFFFIKKKGRIARILFLTVLISFLSDLASTLYAAFIFPNNYPIVNSWHMMNFFVLFTLFKSLIPNYRRFFLVAIISFLIVSLCSFLFIYSFWESNPFVWVTSNLFIISFSIIGFLELLKKPSVSLIKIPSFWIYSVFFCFSTVTFLIWLFFQYFVFELQLTMNELNTIVRIIQIANIIKNLVVIFILMIIDGRFFRYTKAEIA